MDIKLKPKLFDLFQHCELKCNAGCCGWDAFDFSAHWLNRWCDFRDSSIIAQARLDIARMRNEIEGRDADSRINIELFFSPTVASLTENLKMIDAVLEPHDVQSQP